MLVKRLRRSRLSRSLSMLRATPGYCTFIATTLPSSMRAACTCPMLADAMGSTLKWLSCARHPGPNSESRVWSSCFCGMGSAPCRTRSKMAVHCGGTTPSSCMLSICPSFSAAPRILLRLAASRSPFSCVRNREASNMPGEGAVLLLWPAAASPVRLNSSPIAPAAMPSPNCPKPTTRDRGEEGTERALESDVMRMLCTSDHS